MVNVGDKPESLRTAVASGRVTVNESTFALIKNGCMKKGDVLAVAHVLKPPRRTTRPMQAAQERRGAVSRRSVCGIRTSAAPSTTARKKAEAFAATFEKECREGVTSDSRVKFEEYCEYVLELKKGLVPFNVAGKASLPKITHKEVNYFQPEDIANIRSALEDEPIKWRTLTHMLLITGARRGEMLRLGEYYRRQGFVFSQDNGAPMHPDSVTDWLAKFSKRHGLPHINPHAFRHTMASMLYFNGVDSVSISKRLGHAQVSTTANIYAHVMETADKKNVDILADVFLKKA